MKKTLHRGTTVAVGLVGTTMIVVHGVPAPSREDWIALCRCIGELHPIARGLLVVSQGGQPNAAQRKAAIDTLPEGFVAPPVAVVSDDVMVRGIITAMNWFLNDTHRAFKPDDVAGVMKHLRQTEGEVRELFAFARELTPK